MFCFSGPEISLVALANDPKAQVVARKTGNIGTPDRCPQTAEARLPTSAAMNSLGADRGPPRIDLGARTIRLIIIETPFPHVSGHVFDSKRTGAERKRTDRRTLRVTAIDFMIAPGENGVFIREVCEVAAVLLVSPGEPSAVIAFRGVFPFGFGRQSILATFAGAQPIAELDRVQAADVDDWVFFARSSSVLAGVTTIELLIVRVGNQITRNIKPAHRDMRARPFVWRCVVRLASHCEFGRWNKDHRSAK